MIEKFADQHPNYESYRSKDLHVTVIPEDIIPGILGIVHAHIQDNHWLRSAVDIARTSIPMPPTENLRSPYLNTDLSSAYYELARKSLPKFMDCLSKTINQTAPEFVADLNEFLVRENFGYTYVNDCWQLRSDTSHTLVHAIVETQAVLVDDFKEAISHLEQAIRQVNQGDERARKDALRDALSATESFHKQLTGCANIRESSKALRSNS